MATVSNIRLQWQKQADIALDALPFPAAIFDSTGIITAANPLWLATFPGPGERIQTWCESVHTTSPASKAVLLEGCRQGHYTQTYGERDRFRMTVSPCASGSLVIHQDLCPPAETPESRSQKMETVGRLVGGVAHDFANLLTLIAGYSDILLNRIGEKDPLRPELDEIRKAANRGARLTSQLLGFTRGQSVQAKVIDLNTLIADMQRMLRPIIGEYVDLQTVLAPNLGKVSADPGQMEQVIMNLILNARDAMPQGGVIRIETRNSEGGVTLSIADSGHGIDAAAMEHIFEPFFTTKENGRGTGLGLSTVHGIVKQSGGNITVRSAPGEGAIFTVFLPRVQTPADVIDSGAAPREPVAGHETVLLVEDEDGVRKLLNHVLHKRGYNVIEAANGEEALRIFQSRAGEIDLVLTDMVMPKMTGRELAERLRATHPQTRVIFMSGYTDDVLVRTGALSPGMSFLQKPLRPETLAAKVREALDSPYRPFNPR